MPKSKKPSKPVKHPAAPKHSKATKSHHGKPAKPAKLAKPTKAAKATKPAPTKKKPAPARKPAARPHQPSPAHHHKPAKPAPAKHQPPKAHVPSSPKSTNKSSAKAAPAKKVPAPTKPVAAPKAVAAKAPAANPLPATKPAAQPAAKPAVPTMPVPTTKPAPVTKTVSAAKSPAKPQNKAEALRARILERRSAKPIAFTLDEVREIAKTAVSASEAKAAEVKAANKARAAAEELEAKLKKAAQPNYVQAASLADILGYNPAKQAAPTTLKETEIEPKFQRYYKLLIDLRHHVASGLDTHTEQTLKRSTKDDAGDLSAYAQHMADAGTDTFDRDFALSLVANEQEALAEIEAAIQRIKNGTYGVCELTGKPISKDRLLAVPFARFSVESQTEVERTRRRSASRLGLLSEGGENGTYDDGGGEE